MWFSYFERINDDVITKSADVSKPMMQSWFFLHGSQSYGPLYKCARQFCLSPSRSTFSTGGNKFCPPPIHFVYMKKPILNRVKSGLFPFELDTTTRSPTTAVVTTSPSSTSVGCVLEFHSSTLTKVSSFSVFLLKGQLNMNQKHIFACFVLY